MAGPRQGDRFGHDQPEPSDEWAERSEAHPQKPLTVKRVGTALRAFVHPTCFKMAAQRSRSSPRILARQIGPQKRD